MVLEAALPTGFDRRHETRLQRQDTGLSTYLVVWDGEVPVGSGEIRWHGCDAPEVAARFPACPEVNALLVWPPERRSSGIGSALLAAAEDLVRARGIDDIGLGVDDDNPRAARLYLRLGYRETHCTYLDRYTYTLADGTRHHVADPCRFLVKDLRSDATRAG
jgi:GNAT superfamily N-acetyltransferase